MKMESGACAGQDKIKTVFGSGSMDVHNCGMYWLLSFYQPHPWEASSVGKEEGCFVS